MTADGIPLEAKTPSGDFFSLFPFGDLFLEIVNILLGVFLGEQLARFIRYIGFLTQGLKLVSLHLSHHRFLRHYSTPACCRISSIIFEASALVRLSL